MSHSVFTAPVAGLLASHRYSTNSVTGTAATEIPAMRVNAVCNLACEMSAPNNGVYWIQH